MIHVCMYAIHECMPAIHNSEYPWIPGYSTGTCRVANLNPDFHPYFRF